MELHFSARTVLKVLLYTIGITALLHLVTHGIAESINWYIDDNNPLRIFDMDNELSIPTWLSQFILLSAALMAFVVARSQVKLKRADTKYWYVIAVLLLYMSIDEGASIHELVSGPLTSLFHTSGSLFSFGWVIAGLAVVTLVAIFFFRFWWRLPSRVRKLLAIAAIIYIGGTVGMEMIGGYFDSHYGRGFIYDILTMLEESMEMLGAGLALYTFMIYQKQIVKNTAITLED